MNINLLPDKFYKNQASLFLIILFLVLTGVGAAGLATIYLVTQQEAKTLEESVQTQKMEQAQLMSQISNLKKEQSEEVQQYLTELKGKQVLFADMAKNLDEVVIKYNQTIETYQIAIPLLEVAENEAVAVPPKEELTTEDGQEVIQFDLTIKGPKLSDIGALTEALSQIKWVNKATFLSSSFEEDSGDKFESVIQLHMLKEKLPSIDRGGKNK
ncbi:hypothetical protein IGL98_001974 [Enterococcus sp. DIV0840]|uniref:hypothetical protein n=1 Tax=Enterococcus TaxID=1350 RepID=UPI001A8E8374|nr:MULTISPECIES: hypothetical protein [Enterococcus]MBO0432944.1 hypothetical protein [Enterococcus sp. DIV0849a]MBO0475019.1 hypothetical protein [Enterococcus ureasiticus]